MKNIFRVNGRKGLILLIFSIVLAEGTGLLSGYLGMAEMGYYVNLTKPEFSPPGFIFPIVWVILYFLMAVAFYRILMLGKQGRDVKNAVQYYFVQLGLNFLWSIIFFRFHFFGLAFFELIALLVVIILTTAEFYKKDKHAGLLMLPYILWVAFAAYLNYSIWMLNK